MNESRDPSEIHLQVFEELIGQFEKLESDDFGVTVFLSQKKRIAFPTSSKEAQVLKQELSNATPGQLIAILRTDGSMNPILIRKLKS